MSSKIAVRYVTVGLVLQLAVVVALICAVSSMLSTFDAIGETGDQSGAAQAISRHLVRMRIVSSVGIIAGLGGLVFLAIGISRGARSRWVFRSSVSATIFWLPLFPIGSLIGVTALVLLMTQREKFGEGKGPNQALLPTTTAVTPPAGQEPRQP